jgi:2-polyprenyl-6-hydroxyphenyl methylase/3-demethylubiquinone-9 3-methyltransferase
MFGPYERKIADVYRSLFIDINQFVSLTNDWAPTAKKILEVGCGEGAVTERLVANYPTSTVTAIDITPRIGRLYRGSRDRVQFTRCEVQVIARREAGQYDLVILSDVLHHVPFALRRELLDAIRTSMAPSGMFVCKEWERRLSPIHFLAYASDRWLTGDRVRYLTRKEMRECLAATFGEAALVAEARVGPWHNNLATLVRS